MIERVHLFIYGAVTGVNYRAWMVEKAEELELTGWVRNASDNTVEAIVEGEKENLQKIIELCHNGPDSAWVDKIDVKWEEAEGEFEDFSIRY